MGRKKIETPRITIRINPGDKELLDELAEVEGTTISEICRHWISDRARQVRAMEDNRKAVKLMEGFLGKVQEEMLGAGLEPQKVADIFGLGDLDEPEPPAKKARPSNTGPKGPKVAPEKSVKPTKKVA